MNIQTSGWRLPFYSKASQHPRCKSLRAFRKLKWLRSSLGEKGRRFGVLLLGEETYHQCRPPSRLWEERLSQPILSLEHTCLTHKVFWQVEGALLKWWHHLPSADLNSVYCIFSNLLEPSNMPTQCTKITAVLLCWNSFSSCLKIGKHLWIFVETKLKFILFAPQLFLVRGLYLNCLSLERHFWVRRC